MADLNQTFQDVLADLGKRSGELDIKEVELKAREGQLEQLKDELDKEKMVVSAEAARLASTLKVEEAIKEIKDRELTVAEQLQLLGAKKTELVVLENRMADIKAFQDEKEINLKKREQEVSIREQTYKETLKKEFFEELNKRFPQ